jgi:hypothetical protein
VQIRRCTDTAAKRDHQASDAPRRSAGSGLSQRTPTTNDDEQHRSTRTGRLAARAQDPASTPRATSSTFATWIGPPMLDGRQPDVAGLPSRRAVPRSQGATSRRARTIPRPDVTVSRLRSRSSSASPPARPAAHAAVAPATARRLRELGPGAQRGRVALAPRASVVTPGSSTSRSLEAADPRVRGSFLRPLSGTARGCSSSGCRGRTAAAARVFGRRLCLRRR